MLQGGDDRREGRRPLVPAGQGEVRLGVGRGAVDAQGQGRRGAVEPRAGVVRVDKNIEWIQTYVHDRGGAPEGFAIDMSTGGCQAARGAVTMWSLGLGLFFLGARRRRRVF